MPAIKQEPPSSPPHVSPYSLRQRRKHPYQRPAPTWPPDHNGGYLSEPGRLPTAPAKNPAAPLRTAKKKEVTIFEDAPALAPVYSDEDQTTLQQARFTVQEAEVTAALVKQLGGLFPVQKKKHGRKNAARARSVLERLGRIEAGVAAWGQRHGHSSAEFETARAVAKEVGMWRQALEGCGWEEWEVGDEEYRCRGRAALEELLGEVRVVEEMLQEGAQGRKGGAENEIRALAKRYLQVFHLLACGSGLDEAQGVEMEVIRGQMAMLPTGTERTAEDILAEEAAFLCSVIINGPGGVKRAEQ